MIGTSFHRMVVSLDDPTVVVFSRGASALAIFAFSPSLFDAAALVEIARGGVRANLGSVGSDGLRALSLVGTHGEALFAGRVSVHLP